MFPSVGAPTGNCTAQSNDSVLSALSSIQSSLSDMNSRIQAQHPTTENLHFPSPASFNLASATVQLPIALEPQDDDIIPATVPWRTM
ncbi:hypothetical protein QQF64_014682 [Cirrhinus molitorella]|uniref:Uncharacterized protein n=1 Tax=Cirrhinus molitorella TaxID=172907 RepID=A0ABR3NST5_9TELE